MAGSNTWSNGTSDFSSGTNDTASCGSVSGIGSGTVSVAGISWVSQPAVGSGSLSVVGVGSGLVMTDVRRGWTLGIESSSTSFTAKRIVVDSPARISSWHE